MNLSIRREDLQCGDKRLRVNIETTYGELKLVATALVMCVGGYAVSFKDSLLSP